MKTNNIIQAKSYSFALRIIKLYKYLQENKKEFVLSKQILKSGTSIGANVEEAIGCQSQKDFYTKITIAYKEARETHYWIRLLTDSSFIDNIQSKSLIEDCEEVLRIIGTIQKTVKENIRNS